MSLVGQVIEGAMEVVTSALSFRQRWLGDLSAMRARQEQAARALHEQLREARAEVDRLEEPRRRLHRLEAEALRLSCAHDREREELERQIAAHPPRELVRFQHDLERFAAARRDVPSLVEQRNRLGDPEVKPESLAELNAYTAAMAIVTEARAALLRMPLQDRATVRATIEEFRRRLAKFDADMAPEDAG